MARHRIEVADVVRAFGSELEAARGGAIPSACRRVLNDIVTCRTKSLGGHVDRCDRCGHEEISYNSCRNRHCPKCQASARIAWLKKREAELLAVPYYHVVFTMPHALGPLARQNPRLVYEMLFRTSSDTLRTVAADPKHLGAEVGILSILHTWGQNLEYHPHVHCVVTGGGISADHSRWVSCRRGFFVPVRVLSRLFRGKFLARLKAAHRRGELSLRGALAPLADPAEFQGLLRQLYAKEWVVYSKAPFGGPERVLKYLGRYTHRVAISNQRLVGMDERTVSFLWKDYAHRCRKRVMTVSGVEFLRRFLLHVLPKGFVRIRHSGFLGNGQRAEKLALCRRLVDAHSAEASPPAASAASEPTDKRFRCPVCHDGHMEIFERFDAGRIPRRLAPDHVDTS